MLLSVCTFLTKCLGQVCDVGTPLLDGYVSFIAKLAKNEEMRWGEVRMRKVIHAQMP